MNLSALMSGIALTPLIPPAHGRGGRSDPFDIRGITNVCADIRDIDTGTLFILLRGVSYDTDALIPYILSRSPAAIVAQPTPGILALADRTDSPPILLVENARLALSYAMYRFCGIRDESFQLFGVTGTNGKTSTATMLAHILEAAGHTVGCFLTGEIRIGNRRISSEHYAMTTPDPSVLYPALAQMQANGCDCVVAEISSHALALAKVAPLRFFCGVFTGLASDHMDFHKSTEEYYQAKRRLFLQSEHAVIETDDAAGVRLSQECPCPGLSFGENAGAYLCALNVKERNTDGVDYTLRESGNLFPVCLQVNGRFQARNSLGAIGAAMLAGIPVQTAIRALASLERVEGRMEVFRADDVCVIVDYAHTAAALENLLQYARRMCTQGEVICIFGCGGQRDKEKRPQMARVAEKYADRVIVTSDNSREENLSSILRDIMSGFQKTQGHTVISDREHAVRQAIRTANPHDVIVVAGKGRETYQVDRNTIRGYDERKIVSDALKARRKGNTGMYENQT